MPARPDGLLEALRRVGTGTGRGQYTVWRIVDPGRVLSAEQSSALAEVCIDVGNRMVGADISAYWEQRGGYFQQLSEWWFAESGDEIVGWCGIKIVDDGPEPLYYLDTLGFVEGHRRQGLATLLSVEPWLRTCLRRRRLLPLTYRTQSPVVYRLAQSIMGPYLFPPVAPYSSSRSSRRMRPRAVAAAEAIARRLSPDVPFDRETFVSRRAFGYLGSLYGSKPPASRESAVDAFFDAEVDAEAGDAMICVIPLTPWGIVRCLAATLSVVWRMRAARRRRR